MGAFSRLEEDIALGGLNSEGSKRGVCGEVCRDEGFELDDSLRLREV